MLGTFPWNKFESKSIDATGGTDVNEGSKDAGELNDSGEPKVTAELRDVAELNLIGESDVITGSKAATDLNIAGKSKATEGPNTIVESKSCRGAKRRWRVKCHQKADCPNLGEELGQSRGHHGHERCR